MGRVCRLAHNNLEYITCNVEFILISQHQTPGFMLYMVFRFALWLKLGIVAIVSFWLKNYQILTLI